MLVLCGRQFSLLCISSGQDPEFAERYHGYADTLQRQGCKVDADLQVDALSAQQSGHDAASTLLARGIAFDAIFAASDLIAIGAMQALSECGIRVPEQVSVAGFDDIPMASCVNPALTTPSQATRRAGELLVTSLLTRLNGETGGAHV